MDRLLKKRLGKRLLIIIDQEVNNKKMSRCTFCTGHLLFGYINSVIIPYVKILDSDWSRAMD